MPPKHAGHRDDDEHERRGEGRGEHEGNRGEGDRHDGPGRRDHDGRERHHEGERREGERRDHDGPGRGDDDHEGRRGEHGQGGGRRHENFSPELKQAIETARGDRQELHNAPENLKAQCREALKNSTAEVIRLGGREEDI